MTDDRPERRLVPWDEDSAEFYNGQCLIWAAASRARLEPLEASTGESLFESVARLGELYVGIVALHQMLMTASRMERLDPAAQADRPRTRQSFDEAEARVRGMRNLILHLSEHGVGRPVARPGRGQQQPSYLYFGVSGHEIHTAWGSISFGEWRAWLDAVEPWAQAHMERRFDRTIAVAEAIARAKAADLSTD